MDFFIKNRGKIIVVFKIVYVLIICFIAYVFIAMRGNDHMLMLIYEVGKKFGDFSVITYIVTLLPGMGERFNIKNSLLSILRSYRRYIGILMYIFALTHISLTKLFFVTTLDGILPQGSYEVMGLVAILSLLFLFLSSNNISMSRLKIWWYRIQRLTYIAMFFIFLHVALVSISTWTILMGVTTLLQITSFIAVYKRVHSLTGGRPV
jgi:DMSO/TMAO reductase YedYZ heme-binding membrane subunit